MMSFVNKHIENNRSFSPLMGEKITSSSSWLLQSPEKEQFSSTFLPSALQLETEKIIWMEVLGIYHHGKSCKNNCSTSKDRDNCNFLQQEQLHQDHYNFVLDLDSSSIVLPGEKQQQQQQEMIKNDSVSACSRATSLIQVANISSAEHRRRADEAAPSPTSFLATHPSVAGISIIIYLCERLRITAPRVQWTSLWLFVRMLKHSMSAPEAEPNKKNLNKNIFLKKSTTNPSSNSINSRCSLIVGDASRVLYASACVLLSLKECFRTASHHVLVGDPLLIQHKISKEELITAEMKIFSLCTLSSSCSSSFSSSVFSNDNNFHEDTAPPSTSRTSGKVFADFSRSSASSTVAADNSSNGNNHNSKLLPHRQQLAIVDCYIGPSWLFRCFECLFELEPVLCRASGGLMLHWRTLAQKISRKNNDSHCHNENNDNQQQQSNIYSENNDNNNIHHDAIRRTRTTTSMAVDQDEAMRLSSCSNNLQQIHNHGPSSSLSNVFSKINEKNVCSEEDEEQSRLSNQITQDGAVSGRKHREHVKKSQNKTSNSINNQDKAADIFHENNFTFHENNTNDQNTGGNTIYKKNNTNNHNQQPLLPLPMFLRGSTTSESTCVFSLMRELHKHNLISEKSFFNDNFDDDDENNCINRKQGKIPPPNSPAPSLARSNKTNSSSSSHSSSSSSNIPQQDSKKNILDRISTKNVNQQDGQTKNSLFRNNDNNNNNGPSRSDHLHHEEQENNFFQRQQQLRYFNSAMIAACSRRPADPTVSPHEFFRVNELYRRRIREASQQVSTIATMALLHSCHFSTSSSSSADDHDNDDDRNNENDNSSRDELPKITLDEIFSPFFPLAVFHSCGFLPVQDAAMIFGFENENKKEGLASTNNNYQSQKFDASCDVSPSTNSINCIFSDLHRHVGELVVKVPSLNHLRNPSDIILSMARKLTMLAFHGDRSNNEKNNNRNSKNLNQDDVLGNHQQNNKNKSTKFLNLSAHSGRSSDGVLASALESLGLS